MKKNLLLFIGMVLSANFCYAQQILWEQLWTEGNSGLTYTIKKITDTTYIVGGESGCPTCKSHYFKLYNNGSINWQRPINRTLRFANSDIISTADGGFIHTGSHRENSQTNLSDLFLRKINSTGDSVWTKVYATPTERANFPTKVLELPNKDLAVLGYADLGPQRSYSLLLTDSLGNQRWYKHFAKGLNANSAGMVLNHKGNFVLSGFTTPNTVTLYSRPYLIEVSPIGDSIQSKSFVVNNVNYNERINRVYNNIIQTQDSGYIFSGTYDSLANTSQSNFYLRGMIVKTDSAFNVQWTYFFYPPNSTPGVLITKILEQPNGSLLFLANDEFGIQNKFYIVHLSSQGQFLSYQTYNSQICSNSVRPYDFIILQDSSAIIVGMCYIGTKGYLARVKEIYSGSTVLSTPEAMPGQKAALADAYPNPASNEVTIPYSVPAHTREATLEIRELVTGRVVKEVELSERGQQQAKVELANLKPGIYSYTLIVDGKRIATKKLFVMKQ